MILIAARGRLGAIPPATPAWRACPARPTTARRASTAVPTTSASAAAKRGLIAKVESARLIILAKAAPRTANAPPARCVRTAPALRPAVLKTPAGWALAAATCAASISELIHSTAVRVATRAARGRLAARASACRWAPTPTAKPAVTAAAPDKAAAEINVQQPTPPLNAEPAG